MNILIINHYAGSPAMGMEFRPYYFAHEWTKAGHKVIIIASSYSHLRTKQPLVAHDLYEEFIDGIKYVWIKCPTYRNSTRRVVNMTFFICKLQYYSKDIANKFKPDLVIASSTYPLDIYPSKKIAKQSRAKLVYEVHDLWPLSPMLIGGYSKEHPFIKVMQKGENDSYKFCDKVVSLLWNSGSHMKRHGLEDGKFIYIPNGFCEKEWEYQSFIELPEEHIQLLKKLRTEGKIIIGFAGGHTPSTAMDTFIEAANILKKNTNIAFVLIGDGISKIHLIEKANSYKLHNVYFLSSIKKKAIPFAISYFDIAYMGGTHSVLHQYGTSFNKMADYMLSSKPIISSIDEPNSIIERVGCGIRVAAEAPLEVASAIKYLSQKSIKERMEMGALGYQYAMNNLSYSVLANRMLEEIFK